MGIGPTDIHATLQNGVAAIRDLIATINGVFPHAGPISSSAPAAGAVTFTSSQSAGFLSVTTSSGGVYRVPLY